jgi:hypothetical protein
MEPGGLVYARAGMVSVWSDENVHVCYAIVLELADMFGVYVGFEK